MGHALRNGLILALAAVAATSGAAARVGVTSETNGEPMGRPPAQDERILRVGVDIQADEVVTTRANDAAHLVFLDGTSLTVSSNAQVKVDRFMGGIFGTVRSQNPAAGTEQPKNSTVTLVIV